MVACVTMWAAASIGIQLMPAWRIPHFEKMLYDQAQLTRRVSGGGAAELAMSRFFDVAQRHARGTWRGS